MLSDLRFPGSGNGFDVAAEAAKRGIPCVIMSGAAHLGAEIEARGIPFLAKPFHLTELRYSVANATAGNIAIRERTAHISQRCAP